MTVLHIPPWAWAATIAALAVLLGTDFTVSGRRPGPPGLVTAALWTLATVAAAAGFGVLLAVTAGGTAAGQFYAGWLTEYSLSVDNLFVFAVLIGASRVPRRLHGRVLLTGILLALVLRGGVIALGATALSRFSWVEYVFGAFLLATSYRLVRQPDGPDRRAAGPLHAARRLLPVALEADSGRLVVRVRGHLRVTPVLVLIIAIGVTDVLFAMDSIPAIFGLTRDPFLVFTANLFALLGLRHLYFLIGGLLGRLQYLPAGLAAVLSFIGFKIICEGLRDSGVPRVGQVPVPTFSAGLSLGIIGGLIAITAVTSLAVEWRRKAQRRAIPLPLPAPPARRALPAGDAGRGRPRRTAGGPEQTAPGDCPG